MRVKLILPALTEAKSPFFRPIKYSLFPPLGLATLAGYLDDDDEVTLQDEHVETLDLDDEPDLVVIQVYITSASRAYQLADHYRRRGAHVALGGLHVTSLPDEAARPRRHHLPRPGRGHLARLPGRLSAPDGRPRATARRSAPWSACRRIRRDLIKRHLYLVPNSIVVSRGCPHSCDFCYKEAFFQGGKAFYTQAVDDALAEIERLPGRHLYFLDDHLFGNAAVRERALRGHARHEPGLAGGRDGRRRCCGPGCSSKRRRGRAPQPLRGLRDAQRRRTCASRASCQNLHRDYGAAIRRLHDLGVMVNGSFVFGMDGDDASVFDRTVEWAIEQGIETATFHILTPYPGTALYDRMRRRAASSTTTGISTTPATWSIARRA